jgi:Glycosyl transferases group 1
VISFCGDDLLGTPSSGLRWRIRGRCARWVGLWAAFNASAIVVKSDNLKESLPDRLNNKGVVTVLPNGVDINWFYPMNQGECRARLGWPREGKIALFNASSKEDQYRKNPALARATLDSVARSMPGADLRMMSNASHEEVRLMMNAADCLLVTSLHEGSPNIVKEAMSCNLPVVSVPCGDVVERLKAVFPGGVRSFDVHDLAQAVVEVFRSGIRSNGRDQLIVQGLTTFHVAERLIHIYRRVQEESLSTAVVSQETRCVE